MAEDHADDLDFDSDRAFEQALTDARRMITPGYSRLFGSSGAESLDEVPTYATRGPQSKRPKG